MTKVIIRYLGVGLIYFTLVTDRGSRADFTATGFSDGILELQRFNPKSPILFTIRYHNSFTLRFSATSKELENKYIIQNKEDRLNELKL